MKPCSIIRRRIEAITAERSMMLRVDVLAPQIEVAVLEPDILGIVLLADDRHRQLGRCRLDRRRRAHGPRFRPSAGSGSPSPSTGRPTSPSTVTTDSTRIRSSVLERRRVRVGDDLRDPVMVAKVDEQQMAVVALAMHPARQADGLTDVAGAQFGAVVGTIGVHDESALLERKIVEKSARRASMGRSIFVNPRGRR